MSVTDICQIVLGVNFVFGVIVRQGGLSHGSSTPTKQSAHILIGILFTTLYNKRSPIITIESNS